MCGKARVPTGASVPLDRANQWRCPGYVKDHIKPLACRGPDTAANLQWQTIQAARVKDKWERKSCAR